MSGSYNNFLDKMRAHNYASIRKSANNHVTINGPNTFTCVKKKLLIDNECGNGHYNYDNCPYITNYQCNNEEFNFVKFFIERLRYIMCFTL
jgi:hypothetical protein